jgi:hypothetical protein
MSYRKYTVTVGTEPSLYGSDCTPEQGERFAVYLAMLVAEEFESIRVIVRDNSGPVRGPDAETCEEIRSWIQETGFPLCMEVVS